MRVPVAMAFRIVSVAAFASGDFVMAPPTMTMLAPDCTASAAVSELIPSCGGDGDANLRSNDLQPFEGELPVHLKVNGRVDADDGRPEPLDLDGALGHPVAPLQAHQVHGDARVIATGGLDALADGGVGGDGKDVNNVCAGLGGGLCLNAAGVHDFHVGEDGGRWELAPKRTDRVEAFALDEGRARFEPLDAARDGLSRDAERLVEVDKIKGKLEDGFHAPTALAEKGLETGMDRMHTTGNGAPGSACLGSALLRAAASTEYMAPGRSAQGRRAARCPGHPKASMRPLLSVTPAGPVERRPRSGCGGVGEARVPRLASVCSR